MQLIHSLTLTHALTLSLPLPLSLSLSWVSVHDLVGVETPKEISHPFCRKCNTPWPRSIMVCGAWRKLMPNMASEVRGLTTTISVSISLPSNWSVMHVHPWMVRGVPPALTSGGPGHGFSSDVQAEIWFQIYCRRRVTAAPVSTSSVIGVPLRVLRRR